MFKLLRTEVMKEYDGKSMFYVHDKTGMEVFHIKNSSSELSCAFTFATPSEDSKGVAHILEHTVLCGSKRYPVKDPFAQLLLSSPNTFLNAVTFCDKTMYPFSSPLKKDFDIIFGIYADAVFAPLLRRQSFEQEGIRAFGTNFDGVVYNEMTGDRSTEDSIVQIAGVKQLYAGTPYEYESGGDPVYIADLSYEEYLARYRKWYSPSNCRLFFFGDLDVNEYLDKLENLYLSDLSGWDNSKIILRASDFNNPGVKPARNKMQCATENANSVMLTWLTKQSDDPLQVMTLSVLVDILLGNPGAPLYRAITESGLGHDLNPMSGMDCEYPVMPFMVGFSGAKENAEDEIESFILDKIKYYAEIGIPSDAVKAGLKQQEFSIQEIPGGRIPYGLNVALRAYRTWMRGGMPESGVRCIETLEKLKKLVSQGNYFENWIKENLLENPIRCLSTVQYSPVYSDGRQSILAAKLKAVHSDDSVNWAARNLEFESFVQIKDSPQDLATIGRITRSDLMLDVPDYKHNMSYSGKSRVYSFEQFCRGIVYLDIAFDTRQLSEQEKILLPVLVRFLQMCGTHCMDYTETGTRIKNLTGGFAITFYIGKDNSGNPVSNVIVKTKMLYSDYKEAISFIGDILLDCNLDDLQRIKAAVTDIVTEFSSSYIDNGSAFASLYSSSKLSRTALENDISIGTSCFLNAVETENNFSKDKEKLAVLLKALKDRIFTQSAMTVHLSTDSENIGSCVSEIDSFTSRFAEGEKIVLSDFYKNDIVGESKTVLAVSDAPAFNAMTLKIDNLEKEDIIRCILLSSVLSHNYLWNEVRGKGGAYGVESHADIQENLIMFSSYRDPRTAGTYEVFRNSLVSSPDPDQVEYAVVSIVGKTLKPMSPGEKSNEDFRRILFGLDSSILQERRRILLSCDCDKLRKLGSAIAENLDKTSMATVCGSDLSETLDSFEKVRLPL